MIILDTNIVSELMRQQPDQNVKHWISEQKPFHLAITAITIAEIHYGIQRLPFGKRRDQLEQRFKAFVDEVFVGRIFSFDEEAAYHYGSLYAHSVSEGHNVDAVDMMIAAIVKQHDALLATRNIKDFKQCDIKLVDPFSSSEVMH
jgi:predicted nucleic acid-binding protein